MADEDNGQTGDEGGTTATVTTTTAGWTPPSTPDELNSIIEKRLQRERARYKDYDTLKARAARADELESATATDLEKAAKAAREEGRNEALREATPRLVRAEFRAAAKGVLSGEQLTSLLEDIDLARFVTDSGEVDEEKIGKKIAALAPPKEEEPKSRFPDLGGGQRGGASTSVNMNDVIRNAAGLGR